jgi:hypothetical protein
MTSEHYDRQYLEFKEKATKDNRFVVEEGDKRVHLTEDTESYSFDPHYVYHTAWAARRVYANKPAKHVDISSYLYFSTIISAFVPVEFYDYRPVSFDIENFSSGKADLTRLFQPDGSVESLSCMHVIEHIGLGRYGDPLNPQGDEIAAKELMRVLSPGGILYIVLPVASANRVYFNAHRVYSFQGVLSLFPGMLLKSNALLSDRTRSLVINASENEFNQQSYGCGCFEFQKESQ